MTEAIPPVEVSPDSFVTVAIEPVGGPLGEVPDAVIPIPTTFVLDQGELPRIAFLSNSSTGIGAVYDRAGEDDRLRYVTLPNGDPGWLVCACYRYRPGSDRLGAYGPPVGAS